MSVVLIADLLDPSTKLELNVVAGGSGKDREIAVPRLQKPGLALTGYAEQLHDKRLLTLGGTEVEYLASISEDARKTAIGTVMCSEPACVVMTRGLAPPELLVRECERLGVALLVTPLSSADFIKRATAWLDVALAPSVTVHGVMVDVLELGILLRGRSGVGKSEAALELVERGHRLVSDDIVRLHRRADDTLVGASSRELGHHMEIRGLGIINIAHLFGITSVRESKHLDLVVELEAWRDGEDYDRLGIDDCTTTLLDVEVPFVRLPLRPGRNIASIIEVAARSRIVRKLGYDSASDFISRLDARLVQSGAGEAS